MSWTLVRHKNGQEVPIKVSIFDAFRSKPSRDESPAEMSHIRRSKANTKVPLAPKSRFTSGSWSTSGAEVWTEKDDRILRDLKTSNNSWKQIIAALPNTHNSESQAKARWKEIEGRAVGGTAGSGDANAQNKAEEKKAKAERAKAEGLARKAAGQKGKWGKAEKKGVSKNNNTEAAVSQEDELKYLAVKYDKDKWLAMASKHFDLTGERISPERAKEICGATD